MNSRAGIQEAMGEPSMLLRNAEERNSQSLKAQWDKNKERKVERDSEVQTEISLECAEWSQRHHARHICDEAVLFLSYLPPSGCHHNPSLGFSQLK